MSKAYVGISLMVSPHPSYPPLEMAAFGMQVITNNYSDKNMNLYDNIIALDTCTPSNLCNMLIKLCHEYSSEVKTNIDEKYVCYNNIDDICNQLVIK